MGREKTDEHADVDACDHVIADEDATLDEDLPETNLVPGLDKSPKVEGKRTQRVRMTDRRGQT